MKEILSDEEISHALNEGLLAEAESLKVERKTLKERMEKLEETRSAVSDAVYQRVRSDYNAKIQQSTERMVALRRSLEIEEKKLFEKRLIVEANIKFHKEKIEESALRHALGEFSSTDHESLMSSEAQEIARLEVALAKLTEGLGRHRQIFEGEELPQSPVPRPAPLPQPVERAAPPPPPQRQAPPTPQPAPVDDFELEHSPPPRVVGEHTDKIRLEGHTDRTEIDEEPSAVSQSSKLSSEKPRNACELIVLENGKPIQSVPLDRTIQIGRSPSNDVVLKEPKVSRKHAEIQYVGGRYVLMDLESSNGTYVGGKRVSEQVLQPNDEITIGNTKMMFKG